MCGEITIHHRHLIPSLRAEESYGHSDEQPTVEIGFFLQRKGIGAGGGRHTPELERCWNPTGNLYIRADGRNRTSETLRNYSGGLFSSSNEHLAGGNAGQQRRDVGGGDHLQEGVGGIVP